MPIPATQGGPHRGVSSDPGVASCSAEGSADSAKFTVCLGTSPGTAAAGFLVTSLVDASAAGFLVASSVVGSAAGFLVASSVVGSAAGFLVASSVVGSSAGFLVASSLGMISSSVPETSACDAYPHHSVVSLVACTHDPSRVPYDVTDIPSQVFPSAGISCVYALMFATLMHNYRAAYHV